MGTLSNKWTLFTSISVVKTLRFNLTYFTLGVAMRFPVYVSRKVHLNKMGGRVVLDAPLRSGMIRLGFNTIGVFDYKTSRSMWDVAGTVVFKGSAEIGQGFKLCTGPEGVMTLGDAFKLTAQSTLISYKEVSIGADCLISWDVLIMDTDFHSISDKQGSVINSPKAIIIGDHVWIGCRSLVLKGAIIPHTSVVAANSLVNAKLDVQGAVYAGSPAKPVREGITWNQ